MKHPKTFTAVVTVAGLLILGIVIGLVVIYSGLPNVAASRPEGAVTSWVLGTTMDHSVRRQASDISPDLSHANLADGAQHYSAMCAMCHGGPGDVQPNAIGMGLNPDAPNLIKAAGYWKPGEIYWIIDNGIKMTGMPAFGKTLSPPQLTNLTAFVEQMPKMTPQEYQDLLGAGPTTTKDTTK